MDELASKNAKTAFSLLIFTFSLVYYFTYYNYGINMVDEGWLVNPAMRVIDGQRPYVDFQHVYGPGRFYVTAWLFQLFGQDLIVTRILWIFLRSVCSVMVFLIGMELMPLGFALVPALLTTIVPGHLHKTPFTFFIILYFLVLQRYADTRKNAYVFCMGLTIALAFLFRQDIGLFALIATAATVVAGLLRRKGLITPGFAARGAGWLMLGMAVVLVPYTLASLDIIVPQVEQTFLKRMTGGAAALNVPYPDLADAVRKFGLLDGRTYKTLLFYIPPVVYAVLLADVALSWVRGKFTGREVFLAGSLLLAFASLNQVYWQSNYGHLLQVAAPCYLFGSYLAYRVYQWAAARSGRAAGATVITAALLLAASFVYFNVAVTTEGVDGSIGVRRFESAKIESPRAGVYVRADMAAQINQVIRLIDENTKEGDSIFVFPQSSLFYFMTGRKNPTRYDFFETALPSVDAERELIASLKKGRVRLIVYDETDGYMGRERPQSLYFRNYAKEVYDYIFANYEQIASAGRYRVLLLREKDGATPGE